LPTVTREARRVALITTVASCPSFQTPRYERVSGVSPTGAEHAAEPVVVLGMHRSGTSSLAGCLQEAGLYLGEVVEQAPHNARGNRESLRIRAVNDMVLEHNGGSWDKPPRVIKWDDELRIQRDNAVAAHVTRVGRWGFKDPRTVLTIDFWAEAYPHLELVGTFRHPLSVARSLRERGRWSLERGLALWSAYNERLLSLHGARSFPLISFDLPQDEYLAAVALVASRLGLAGVVSTRRFSFFSDELRHHDKPRDSELPYEIARLYDSLCDRSSA
jgi:hypothetical protein